MPIIIGLFIVAIVAAIVILMVLPDNEDKRKNYLAQLAKLLEGQCDLIEGTEDCYRVQFNFRGKNFIYEDIMEEGFQQRRFQRGYLKVPLGINLVLSFTERERSTLVENATLRNIGTGWHKNLGNSRSAKKMSAFDIYTNNQGLVDVLMADEEILNMFAGFKNIDSRGHPFMALDILEGYLILRFYSREGFKPDLIDLQDNVSRIEGYLDLLSRMVDKIQRQASDKGFLQ